MLVMIMRFIVCHSMFTKGHWTETNLVTDNVIRKHDSQSHKPPNKKLVKNTSKQLIFPDLITKVDTITIRPVTKPHIDDKMNNLWGILTSLFVFAMP